MAAAMEAVAQDQPEIRLANKINGKPGTPSTTGAGNTNRVTAGLQCSASLACSGQDA